MDIFEKTSLQALVDKKVNVAIYLLNGIRLNGVIAAFDEDTLYLTGFTQMMVYKSHVATIMPVEAEVEDTSSTVT